MSHHELQDRQGSKHDGYGQSRADQQASAGAELLGSAAMAKHLRVLSAHGPADQAPSGVELHTQPAALPRDDDTTGAARQTPVQHPGP
jgi:hypothetical protein